MDIETLKVFCDLAQSKSFSKTAEKHLLSQSAISQQLAQLELVHKCQLIDRKKRPIELTKAGQLFYITCKDIVDRYGQFKTELSALQKFSEERIKVGAIYSIGMHTLPEYVKKFMVKYPNVNVHIEYLDPDKVYEEVLNGDIDIGLVAVPKHDKRLEVYELDSEPLVLVCSPKHFLAGQSEVDIHKIQFERYIAFGADVPTRQWVDSILSRYNISIRPAMEFDNIETIKRAVEINSGISILPETAIVQEVRSGTLKALSFSNEKFARPTGIIVRKNRVLGRAGQYFIELLRRKEA
jgi:LysR family transcriptional regulator, transcriptional activator of the cysJI operon